MAELTYTEKLVTTVCWCGVHLAIPANLDRWLRESDTHSCYCPTGHKFVYSDGFEQQLEKERKRLREEQQRLRATRDLLRAEERAHAATKGSLTKVKKRAANGVCPCCKRSFVQLHRHMKAKHPDYVEGANA